MNFLLLSSTCILLSFIIKKKIKNLKLQSSLKNYTNSLLKIKDFSNNSTVLRNELNKLSKYGSILILKLFLFSLPYFIVFLVFSLIQLDGQIKFFIPLCPYLVLFLNDEL